MLPLTPTEAAAEIDTIVQLANKRILTTFAQEDALGVSFLSPVELKGDGPAFALVALRPDGIWINRLGERQLLKPSSLKVLTSECFNSEHLLDFPWSTNYPNDQVKVADIYDDFFYRFCFGQQEMRTRREFELVRSVRALGGDPTLSPASTTESSPSEPFSVAELVELSVIDYWNDSIATEVESIVFTDLDMKLFARAYLTLVSFTSARVQRTPNWEKFARFARMGAFDLDYYRRFEFAATQCSGEYCL
jgi:hypothetical protein